MAYSRSRAASWSPEHSASAAAASAAGYPARRRGIENFNRHKPKAASEAEQREIDFASIDPCGWGCGRVAQKGRATFTMYVGPGPLLCQAVQSGTLQRQRCFSLVFLKPGCTCCCEPPHRRIVRCGIRQRRQL